MSDNLANPAPLGLMGFGMTTVLLNIHNAGLFEMNAVIMAMGIFYGGIAQILAGCMEFKKGNTFGTTAFTSYGFFWLTLVFLIYFNGKFGMPANEKGFMACYLFMWGLFRSEERRVGKDRRMEGQSGTSGNLSVACRPVLDACGP